MLTVLVSSLPKLPFHLLFTMDFLSQLSSKVIALLPMVSAVMQLFCWWWYRFVRAIALANNKMISCVALGAKWRIEVMREGQCGWEQVHGLTANVRTKSSWQIAKWPHSFHQALLPFTRSKRKMLPWEGRRTSLPKITWKEDNGIMFFHNLSVVCGSLLL